MNRRYVGGLCVLVTAACLVAALASSCTLFPGGPTRHEDGLGPLGNEGGGAAHTSDKVDPQNGNQSEWTFGLRLCWFSGTLAPVLTEVSPHSTRGSGFHYLGSFIRVFDFQPGNQGIISVAGYPPPTTYVPDQLQSFVGFDVTTPCTSPPSGLYTELLVGLARDGSDGGGWEGVDVAYTDSGRSYVLTINEDLLICGDSTPCHS